MLPTAKIVNDPVHGFIRIPEGRILRILGHPAVQRLRRLSQLGLAHFVYPGAVHTRFAHALGVMHLADEALTTLHRKGITLSTDTWEAVLIGALLHDIGHGPFSHSLEGLILPVSHEELGTQLLSLLEETAGELSEVHALWKKQHPHHFLSELLAGQLDVDRLDYLVRDSFFTGVQEGLVGTERLIYTMQVAGGRLVIEEKGLTSVEKFIVTRRFMYWQVYLHKAVLGAEWLLHQWWKALMASGEIPPLLRQLRETKDLRLFLRIDENILWYWIHEKADAPFPPLRALSRALLWRMPYKVRFIDTEDANVALRQDWESSLPLSLRSWADWFWIEGRAESRAYLPARSEEILILLKSGQVVPLAECSPWLRELSSPMRKPFVGAVPAASLESLLK